jgi:hypothetical protein
MKAWLSIAKSPNIHHSQANEPTHALRDQIGGNTWNMVMIANAN